MNDKPRPRRRIWLRVLLGVGVLVVLLGTYEYFFQYRLATRNPGTVAKGAAPDFSLTDETGRTETLASATAHGPAVLVFYRGYW